MHEALTKNQDYRMPDSPPMLPENLTGDFTVDPAFDGSNSKAAAGDRQSGVKEAVY